MIQGVGASNNRWQVCVVNFGSVYSISNIIPSAKASVKEKSSDTALRISPPIQWGSISYDNWISTTISIVCPNIYHGNGFLCMVFMSHQSLNHASLRL